MRVIAGALRGRTIGAPPGRTTRPTSDRVRESLFNLLGPVARGAAVLDLYAGSGALGIEALSRGAEHVTFVENDRRAVGVLRKNLHALGLGGRSRVIVGDAGAPAEVAPGPWDLVLADPPYDHGTSERLVAEAGRLLGPRGTLVLEHAGDELPPDPPEGLALWKSRRYGRARVTLYSRTAEEAS